MKVLSFGSLNYDKIYTMDHFVLPKETISSLEYGEAYGGKGANQAMALAKAGVTVYHAGKVGQDGQPYIDYLKQFGVHTDYIVKDDETVTGHAIIQVCNGENCIILHGGANQEIDGDMIEEVLQHFEKGDILLIQNEISSLSVLIEKAHEKGLVIVFNTAPMDEKIFTYPLNLVDIFIVNEVEGKGLANTDCDEYKEIAKALNEKYPTQEIVLTCGKDGAYYIHEDECIYQEAFPVKAVDTTAAGDTFSGYFLACKIKGMPIQECMKYAAKASSLCVQKEGAAQSVPSWEEVEKSL